MKNNKLLSVIGATVSVLFLLQSCASGDRITTKESISNLSDNIESLNVEAIPEPVTDPLAQFDLEKSNRLTDTARFLAGMKVENGSNLAEKENENSWLNHQRFFAATWSKLETEQLSKVREWSQTELKEINAVSPNIFYPFSGPDFLYAYSLFSQSEKYILVGLEPVGSVPNLNTISASQLDSQLQEVRDSLYAILQFSFFRTNDMQVDLQKQGVLPVLYVFMARTNNRILDVKYVGIDKDAEIKPLQEGMIPGVEIAFVPEGEAKPRTLYYFSTDLSNDGLQKNPQFAEFISKLDNPISYLKAASYLMYYDSFSEVKNLILSQSSHLLQDDSGMPLNSFDTAKWDLEFYGNYTSPISLFSNRYQPELRQIYVSDKDIKPLNFGIGYKFGVNESNLMLVNLKKEQNESTQSRLTK
jgi:hypothetical protein